MSDPLDQDAAEFWALLLGMVLDAEKRLASWLAMHGLTTPQFYVLKTLSERGGRCPIGQIAKAHGLTNATMTGLVKRLEAFDPPLVRRETDAVDRRSVAVVLTDEGAARYDAVQSDLMVVLKTALSLLTPPERADLLRYLARYMQMMSGS